MNITTTVQTPITNALNDIVYTVWNSDIGTEWSKNDVLDNIGEKELYAWATTRLVSEVYNGGFEQWLSNDYGELHYDALYSLCSRMQNANHTHVVAEVKRMVNRALSIQVEMNDCDVRSNSRHDENTEELDSMDCKFYRLSDLFQKQVEAYLLNRVANSN